MSKKYIYFLKNIYIKQHICFNSNMNSEDFSFAITWMNYILK